MSSAGGHHVHAHSGHFEDQIMIEDEEHAQDINDTKCNEEIKQGESAPGVKVN